MDDPASPAEWGPDGVLRSRRHGDVYFSTEDGLAETRTVFLRGCGLPDAWAGRAQFTVGEIGFGTGLNVAALLTLWRETSQPNAWLNVFSIEAAPLAAHDAARALARWPELAPAAAALVQAWPGRASGLHRVDMPGFRATLDVAVLEAGAALDEWQGAADAWFLDGFSPALNPDAWRSDILQGVARRSRPGARAATFTAAGAVRRDLDAAGFTVTRESGFGRKRHRLTAVLPGRFVEPAAPTRVAVIGAGVAGAALARALGPRAVVLEDVRPGAGASGNPHALVSPRLDAGFGPSARLSARAFARAARLIGEAPGAVLSQGTLQLARDARDERRFAAIAASDLFEPGALAVLTGVASCEAIGEPVGPALAISDGLVIDPLALLSAWVPVARRAGVSALTPSDRGWRLLDASGELVAEAEAIVVAAGWGAAALGLGLPLSPIRGQMSYASGASLALGVGWGGYAAPGPKGLAFGATFDRGDTGTEPRASDDLRNLTILAQGLPNLARRLEGQAVSGRASIRATTPDREPLAGALAGRPGLYVLGGLGSRGFTNAPLLAEHLAALILGAPSPLAASQAGVVNPNRFGPFAG